MALRGIDIASHQAGLNVATIDADFVIVKATQGKAYTNPYCAEWVEAALARGLKVGIYHYIGGQGASGEMDFFYRSCKGWDGRVMWCLDWEAYQNSAWGNLSYLESCISKLKALTGKPPMVYASSSVFPWSLCEKYGCGTWVAQYASMDPTGYQDSPWNEGAYPCAIRQYTSTGRVRGWGGNLDLNKFYGDAAAWDAYCGASTSPDIEETGENDMNLLINVPAEGDVKGCTVWLCNDRMHDIDNPEALSYLKKAYKTATGKEMPVLTLRASKAVPELQRLLQCVRAGVPTAEIIPDIDLFGARSDDRVDGNDGTE